MPWIGVGCESFSTRIVFVGSGLRLLDREPMAVSRLAAGSCVLVSPFAAAVSGALEVVEGIARVYCPCEETEGMTIAFLQAGESIRTDRLCSEGVCVEAITPLCSASSAQTR